MKTIIKDILGQIKLLEKQCSDIQSELRTLHWEDDFISTQILQSDLDFLETELACASFVNCTPHSLTIEGLGELPPSGILPRVSNSYEDCVPLNSIRVRCKTGAGAVTGLPDPVKGLSFIVSGMVRDALSLSDAMSALPEFQSRPDVYAPDTGADAIRNDRGHIVAVRGLVQ